MSETSDKWQRFKEELMLIIKEGLSVADPAEAVRRTVYVADNEINVKGKKFHGKKVHVIGFGKAAYGMLKGLNDALKERIFGGVVIHGSISEKVGNVKVLKGGHPLPDENSLSSTQSLLEYVINDIEDDDITFVLISGGGSAMLELPEEGITLESISTLTKLLINSGADIHEVNTVRKCISRVKGGGLLNYLRGIVISLIISDVVGDDLSIIASGPTEISRIDPCLAIDIIRKRGIWAHAPDDIKMFLSKTCESHVNGYIKVREKRPKEVLNIVIANNYESLKKMKAKATSFGYNALILTSHLSGEAREAGKVIASILKTSVMYGDPITIPLALIAGGETTVTVRGKGRGGRNQELCLSLAIELRNLERDFGGICFASDGIDGNSPAAGAFIFKDLYNLARSEGLNPVDFLEENDSYSFFERFGLAVKTGPTGTNVNDFVVLLVR